ncbi:LacI family DNA-binding transcriptional regulator [Afifella sp. IM 167]|uniref:LacI family DNA-binding transcriptional regulator n=1 Tax=Afifella sp. IM 167 TaxID=2033586 RepID=UPI001CCB0274|nr:LacI family DNA-binding transcriptional regulator [Afifella sp. IM 167]MBZ8134056.1 LacI family transcriptional regulator [Afifella sp. IM 167]
MVDEAEKQPTQLDIARKAGVSTATVSRVLNGSPLVKPALRARVEAVIEQLGYYPHAAARALASNRTFTLGAVVPTLNNAIFAACTNAFEREIQASNYTLLLAVSNYDLGAEEVLVRRLLERGVEGLLLIGNAHSEAVYELLARTRTNYVNTWAWEPQLQLPNIGFSNRRAGAALADHLVGLGHRRIGLVSGIAEGNDRVRERAIGVRERLAAHGLALEEAATTEIRYSVREGRRVLGEFVEAGTLPTALICGNDVIALGVLLEAMERKIPVPEALSITGFDNLPLTEHIRPALTTIDVPASAMGHLAARAILSAIGDGVPVASRELEAPLLVRETTAPPAA